MISRTHENDDARERRALCAAAFACYSVSLASLAAIAYSLSVLALVAAGQQVASLYTTLGVVAR
jgi:hypothetical protein